MNLCAPDSNRAADFPPAPPACTATAALPPKENVMRRIQRDPDSNRTHAVAPAPAISVIL